MFPSESSQRVRKPTGKGRSKFPQQTIHQIIFGGDTKTRGQDGWEEAAVVCLRKLWRGGRAMDKRAVCTRTWVNGVENNHAQMHWQNDQTSWRGFWKLLETYNDLFKFRNTHQGQPFLSLQKSPSTMQNSFVGKRNLDGLLGREPESCSAPHPVAGCQDSHTNHRDFVVCALGFQGKTTHSGCTCRLWRKTRRRQWERCKPASTRQHFERHLAWANTFPGCVPMQELNLEDWNSAGFFWPFRFSLSLCCVWDNLPQYEEAWRRRSILLRGQIWRKSPSPRTNTDTRSQRPTPAATVLKKKERVSDYKSASDNRLKFSFSFLQLEWLKKNPHTHTMKMSFGPLSEWKIHGKTQNKQFGDCAFDHIRC